MTSDRIRRTRRATRLVRGALDRSHHGETCEALYLTSGFVYDSAETAEARFKGEAEGYVYSRYGNPTVRQFEDRIADLEGAEACFGTASGMAAVFSALACQLNAGDRVVASRALFGSCHQVLTKILPRFGIQTTLVDGTDLDQWRTEVAKGCKVVFFESISNPTLELIDIDAVIGIAKAAGAVVVADNVFSTPLLLRPIERGADISIYSGTKHIDGQGRCLGGAILCSKKFYDDLLLPFVRHAGPALSPYNAWTLLKGLETLELRVERMCETTLTVARWLERHPAIRRTVYPGLESHPQHALRRARRQAGGLRADERTGDRRHLQQPRGFQEPDHPPGDHHPPGHPGGRAHRRRHHPGAGAAVGRAGAPGRPDRGPGAGAGSGGAVLLGGVG
jgi:O-succinylhomoserine sulfhydrylase